jgi:hypothetical protein
VVRLNALRHGLLARDVVLPGEDVNAFEEFWNRVRADIAPVGPIEEFLADRVVNSLWRLLRLTRAETALFHWRAYGLKAHQLAEQARSYEENFLHSLSLPTEITDEALHAEAMAALGRAERERDRDELLVGRALDADAREADAFGKLARYETTIERSLFRTLYELRQFQEERRNRPQPPILDDATRDASIHDKHKP